MSFIALQNDLGEDKLFFFKIKHVSACSVISRVHKNIFMMLIQREYTHNNSDVIDPCTLHVLFLSLFGIKIRKQQ